MSALTDDPKRRTVPRWRTFRESVSLGQLDLHAAKLSKPLPDIGEVEKAAKAWEQHNTMGFAGDLLGKASVIGKAALAHEAASWVLEQPDSPRSLRRLAYRLTGQSVASEDIGEAVPLARAEERHARIHSLRRRLNQSPLDAATWIDLARAYVVHGQADKALQPVRNALSLAPLSRFVIRSAVRYFLHTDDAQRARTLLTMCVRTSSDPWLLAAEVACGSVLRRTPHFAKRARAFVAERKVSPKHLSELASAVATLELESGSHRKARQLFALAMLDPTENAVAQAAWATRQDPRIEVPRVAFSAPRAYEAQSWSHLHDQLWDEVVGAADQWLRDEPFSSRPAAFGSWAALIVEGNFEKAVAFSEAGLAVHHLHPMLLNNLAVAFADLGRVDRASNELNKIQGYALDPRTLTAVTATRGLLCFRAGQVERGRNLYRDAVELALRHGDRLAATFALLHLAREELARDEQAAGRILEETSEQIQRLSVLERQLAIRFTAVSGLDRFAVARRVG